MRKTSGITWLGILVLAGCNALPDAEPEEDVAGGRQSLIGGTVAAEGQFPSTLKDYNVGCTVSKVGPRHILTAAHCVLADDGHPLVAPGGAYTFATGAVPSGQTARTSKVVKVHVHPEYAAAVARLKVYPMVHEPAPPDVAVIELEGGLEGIPSATVSTRELRPGTPVILQGYGCETSTRQTHFDPPRLKYNQQAVLDPGVAVIEAFFASRASLQATNFFTLGRYRSAEAASLCYGDSGGPVYLADGTNSLIVGVNAYYGFETGEGISASNYATRFDEGARHNVAQWLKTTVGLTIDSQRATDGQLVTGPTGGPVYLLSKGTKRHVTSMNVLASNGFRPSDILRVGAEALASRPNGKAVGYRSGSLVSDNSGRIYVVELQGGAPFGRYVRRWVQTETVFNQCGFRWSEVIRDPEILGALYEQGPAVTGCPAGQRTAGQLVQGSPRVFVLDRTHATTTRRWIPNLDAFFSHGYKFENMVQASDTAQYPEGPLFGYRSGTLIRASDSARVYLVDQQGSTFVKRHVPSLCTLTRLGLSLEPVKVADPSVVAAHTTGPSIPALCF